MRKKALLVIAAALFLAVGTLTLGSNMGFKISLALKAGYSNYVSLPYYTSYTNAASLLADIPNSTSVERWDNPSGTFQVWTGRGTNFQISPGEAYIVNVSTDSTWVVLGSHNPSLALTLTAGYSNYISVPYHSTATNAASLLAQIPNATAVERWDNPSGTFEVWTGRGTNFPITPGEGYIVNVSTTTNWVPAHY